MTEQEEVKVCKLGPDGFDKIAIIGSAPSSTLLAPFDDPSWGIWCTSPSTFAQVAARKRADVWFELHRWLPYEPGQSGAPGTRPWFSPEFRQFMRDFQGPVYMTEKHADIPNCVQFPYQAMLDKHGPYHFCSSISWMLAWAIEQNPKAIGIFGVDMAAGSEWAYQRPSCQHFMGLAAAAGIQIVLPPESDLMRHSTLYGIGEHNPRHIRITERIKELESQKRAAEQMALNAQIEHAKVAAALDAYNYFLEVWSDDIHPDIRDALSFSGCFVKSIPAEPLSTGAPPAVEG